MNPILADFLPAPKVIEFDNKCTSDNFGSELFDQFTTRFCCSSGGQQVVDQQHTVAWLQCVNVGFESCGSVFEVVGDRVNIVRQFPRLAQRDESDAQFPGSQCPENEASGLHAGYSRNPLVQKRIHDLMYCKSQRSRILHQRGDVLEKDSGFREVGNVPDI